MFTLHVFVASLFLWQDAAKVEYLGTAPPYKAPRGGPKASDALSRAMKYCNPHHAIAAAQEGEQLKPFLNLNSTALLLFRAEKIAFFLLCHSTAACLELGTEKTFNE